MGLVTLAYAISVFWLALHAIRSFLSKRTTDSSILPSSTGSHLRRSSISWFNASHVRVTLHAVHLKIETTGFNALHDAWAAQIRKANRALFRRVITAFYDVGSVAGVLGMIAALGLLWVTVWKSSLSILGWGTTTNGVGDPGRVGTLMKRDFEEIIVDTQSIESNAPPLQLIVSVR